MNFAISRRRWGDNDYFGPFCFARDRQYKPIAIVISSGDDEYEGASLRVSLRGVTAIVAIPAIIKPWRRWVDTSRYAWSHGDGYWSIHERSFGFSYSDGFLQVFLGPQTHDSETEKQWSKFLPWTQWRHVRVSFYGLSGEHFATLMDSAQKSPVRYEQHRDIKRRVPMAAFSFQDFDGEELTADTHITEREWRFGTGWFKWLSFFRRPKIVRSLAIEFSGETGERKGSWKGGTMGTGISMFAGELHEAAFRRYCAKHQMTFLGLAAPRPRRDTFSSAEDQATAGASP